MPILSLKVSGPVDPVRAQELTQAVTDLTATILRKKRELTAVILDVVDPAAWTVGGSTLAEQGLASFALTIKVTAGTNSRDEKAAFVNAVHGRVSAILGPLNEASYVIVEEVPADSWGYGGQTQEYRAATKAVQAA
ncbi:MAG TPA: tautomerase family protein [Microvirga sp.]|jgi:4-oxalocrotonate tautomerase|nr:tautomerase family protein [Microvirga sp.]